MNEEEQYNEFLTNFEEALKNDLNVYKEKMEDIIKISSMKIQNINWWLYPREGLEDLYKFKNHPEDVERLEKIIQNSPLYLLLKKLQ